MSQEDKKNNMKWYTSDTHFGHRNILKYCNRPFADTYEMDETIIRNWNSKVQPTDEVYHLGDVGFYKDDESFDRILSRLNGNKILIWGNHDKQIKKSKELQKHFDFCTPYLEIYEQDPKAEKGSVMLVLSHYSFRVWNKSHHGAINLYGHSHGTLPGTSQCLDVGVDCWDYAPTSYKQIVSRLQTLPKFTAVDHHKNED